MSYPSESVFENMECPVSVLPEAIPRELLVGNTMPLPFFSFHVGRSHNSHHNLPYTSKVSCTNPCGVIGHVALQNRFFSESFQIADFSILGTEALTLLKCIPDMPANIPAN
jgi:hypothetical protein